MKALIDSKTFWFGALQVIFGLVGGYFKFIDEQTAMSLVVTGIGTITLRAQTSTPIGGFLTTEPSNIEK